MKKFLNSSGRRKSTTYARKLSIPHLVHIIFEFWSFSSLSKHANHSHHFLDSRINIQHRIESLFSSTFPFATETIHRCVPPSTIYKCRSFIKYKKHYYQPINEIHIWLLQKLTKFTNAECRRFVRKKSLMKLLVMRIIRYFNCICFKQFPISLRKHNSHK